MKSATRDVLKAEARARRAVARLEARAAKRLARVGRAASKAAEALRAMLGGIAGI
jgi:hypothetical protein